MDLFGILSFLRNRPGFHKTNRSIGTKAASQFVNRSPSQTVIIGSGLSVVGVGASRPIHAVANKPNPANWVGNLGCEALSGRNFICAKNPIAFSHPSGSDVGHWTKSGLPSDCPIRRCRARRRFKFSCPRCPRPARRYRPARRRAIRSSIFGASAKSGCSSRNCSRISAAASGLRSRT